MPPFPRLEKGAWPDGDLKEADLRYFSRRGQTAIVIKQIYLEGATCLSSSPSARPSLNMVVGEVASPSTPPAINTPLEERGGAAGWESRQEQRRQRLLQEPGCKSPNVREKLEEPIFTPTRCPPRPPTPNRGCWELLHSGNV